MQYGQPFNLCSTETGRFLGAAGRRPGDQLPVGRSFGHLQTNPMSLVGNKWADYSLLEAASDTLRGGMVTEILFFEYEACLGVVEGTPHIITTESKYDMRTLWRVEMPFNASSPPGSLVHSHSVVRLRHLSECLYLCRTSDGDASLTANCCDPNAQWQFDIQSAHLPIRETKVK